MPRKIAYVGPGLAGKTTSVSSITGTRVHFQKTLGLPATSRFPPLQVVIAGGNIWYESGHVPDIPWRVGTTEALESLVQLMDTFLGPQR